MVVGPLQKKLFRVLFQQWGQSLAIIAVVACGVAAYICLYSCYLNLKLTRDTYYFQERYAHFEIMVDRAPDTAVFRVEQMPGVRRAQGRIVQDVTVDIEGINEPRTGRIISMPVPHHDVLNDIVLDQGNYFAPGAQDEVIVSDRFALANNLELGDRIDVNIESKQYNLRIIGLAMSPEFVYMIRNIQELIPAPERFGVLWVPRDFAETALNMEAASNSIVGFADDPDHLEPLFDQIDDELEAYGVFAKLDRDNMISNRFISDEIYGLGITAQVTPAIFLAIAAMILFVLLNRMVRIDRTQIGLLKAFGYSNRAVAFHYIEYGFILGVLGCLSGFIVGQWMANGLIRMYVEFYQFPILESRIYPEVLFRSMGITMVFSLLGALSAALRAAAIQPAEAMRPEAPQAAHKTLLEYFPAVWTRLAFTWKMILRNLERNRVRAMLSISGVAVSMGLLIMGYCMLDAMDYMLDFQFREVQREDLRVAFQREHGKETLYDIERFDHVRRAEPVLEYPFTMRAGWRKKDTVVTGLPAGAELKRLINVDGQEVAIESTGLVLSDKLARELAVGPGDTVLLKPLMGRIKKEKSVTVSRVAQQYLGSGAYMDIEALSRILDEPFVMNAVLLRTDEGSALEVKEHLKEIADIASVSFAEEVLQSLLSTLAQSMKMMNVTMLIFAGVIAFSIIYNVTSVALAERERELASLRVLGLTTAEVGRIMYYENFLLGAMGILAGIPVGYGISKWLITMYDTDLFRMPFYIENRTYIWCAVIIGIFVIMANGAVWRKVRRLDLIEVLKERE